MRSRFFQHASDSLYLSLLQDEAFISSVNQIIVSTKQSHDDAMEFILTIAEVDPDSLRADQPAFKVSCLDAVKLSNRDQESLLLLIAEEHRTLQDALNRLRALQNVEDAVIESPSMRQ